ncbi:hypothetical protein KDW_60420 [Dictyobacter vulcani]|uniref:Cas12f1-like TNB domain-containing protein n=1 Tax=Dictyobacter vulcani TaxID=2607529 RepID=A0A5J4KZ92_9CHLR|nr:transposase [Dictyobacter vulcani]GER91880.1 hypothetical protein KDW_60420 [Dictyobacter vulcani]
MIEGAFDDLGDAFSRFFKGQNQYPTFKKKNKSRETFSIANDKFSVGDHWIIVPVLGQFLLDKQQANGILPQKIRNKRTYKRSLGKVNMAESLRFVVPDPNKKAGKWRNERKKIPCSSVKIMGATIGLSGGYWYVSIHVEVPNVSVINTHPIVGGLFKNRCLSRAMADAGLGQLLRLFETKMQTVGGQAIFVSRFFPSTKMCSGCGYVKKRMPLKYRTYCCLKCGLLMDRDLNAAINLERECRRLLEAEE